MAQKAIRLWFLSSLFWLVLAPVIGIVQSLQFLAPEAMDVFSPLTLSYAKLRMLHTNIAIYGWIVMAFVSAVLYIIPRLTATELKLAPVAYWAGWIWNAAVALDGILIWAGIAGSFWFSIQAAEYAEAPFVVDLLIVLAVVMVIASVHLTVIKRERARLYVSVWYLLGGLYTTAITYLAGNFLILGFSGEGYQVIEAWWLHNAVGLIITPLGLGVGYYLIPVAAQQPLYSHRLSILGFWTLMAFYPGTGLHHFLQMPMPTWINEFAVISSVLLGIPVLAVVVNFLATPKGNWQRAFDSFPLRFATLGTLFYLATCIQGPFQATNFVNWYVHFTEWVQAHAHLALAGAFSSFGMGVIIYMFPRVTGRQLYSRGMASLVFWSMVIMFPAFYVGFTWSGVATAASVNLLGNTIYETLTVTWVPRLSRTLTGSLVAIGYLLFVYLVLRSFKLGAPFREGMSEVPELSPRGALAEAQA